MGSDIQSVVVGYQLKIIDGQDKIATLAGFNFIVLIVILLVLVFRRTK